MPPLSNSRFSTDATAYRQAFPHEIHDALRLLLGGINRRTTEEQLLEFIASSQQRGLDVGDVWVASHKGRTVWSLLPVVSPGETMLVLGPPNAPVGAPADTTAAIELTHRVCDKMRTTRSVELAQMLIDPNDSALLQLYETAGFLDLAELIYLHRVTKKIPPVRPLPPSARFENYSEKTHPLFIDSIRRSYVDSLDCPALNGLRDMENVLIGHKHSGEFDPSLWFVLLDGDTPLGVMLLSPAMRGDSVELVYLGLVPEARGARWSDAMMQLAMVTVVRQNKTQLTLAVDSRNVPAIKLYQRHGLSRLGSRRALIRDLRTSVSVSPTSADTPPPSPA